MSQFPTEYSLPLTLEQQARVRPHGKLDLLLRDALSRLEQETELPPGAALIFYPDPDTHHAHTLEFKGLPKPLLDDLTDLAHYHRPTSHGGEWPMKDDPSQVGRVWFSV